MNTRRNLLAPLALTAVVALLYLPRLGTAPVYMAPDEIVVGVDAYSIATTGRDFFQNRTLPLFFEFRRLLVGHKGVRETRVSWLPPAIFYAVAATLKVLPFSEASVRLPTVLVGMLNVVLVYVIGRRFFGNEALAVLAAALLALSPAHVIHSRMAADYLFPVPFVLGWLACLLTYLDTSQERFLWCSAICLGVGLYSYAASPIVMPINLALTFIALAMQRRPARSYLIAAAGLAIPAAFALPWLLLHPSMVTEVLQKYELGGGAASALDGLRSAFSVQRIGDQIALYWGFFNPRLLFFDGPAEPMFSTRQAGVFLLPVAVFFAVGLYAAIRARATPATVLILLGFATSPIAATLVNVGDAIYRALEMLPFVAILAAWGARELWRAPWPAPRRALFFPAGLALLTLGAVYAVRVLATQARVPGGASLLVCTGLFAILLGVLAGRFRLGQLIVLAVAAASLVQFGLFYKDYFTDYRSRSALAFSGNIRGAYEKVLDEAQRSTPPKIYLGEIGAYSYGALYWRFYLIKHGRLDLLDRTTDEHLFYADRVLQLPPQSLVVNNAGDGPTDLIIDQLVAAGRLAKAAVIVEPNGTPTYLVLRKLP
jgi:4-amino-4-deoxy-L-arabinose transferase-like glycosyltransferase